MTNSLKSHIETLREMFALAANERRMKEADALTAAIESLSRQGGEAVAELIHSADALTRMVVLPEGMQLGYGTHKLYASPTRASEAGDSDLLNVIDLIRTGKDGRKYDYAISRADTMVHVAPLFAAAPAPGGEL
jgi:hypothetical protein